MLNLAHVLQAGIGNHEQRAAQPSPSLLGDCTRVGMMGGGQPIDHCTPPLPTVGDMILSTRRWFAGFSEEPGQDLSVTVPSSFWTTVDAPEGRIFVSSPSKLQRRNPQGQGSSRPGAAGCWHRSPGLAGEGGTSWGPSSLFPAWALLGGLGSLPAVSGRSGKALTHPDRCVERTAAKKASPTPRALCILLPEAPLPVNHISCQPALPQRGPCPAQHPLG